MHRFSVLLVDDAPLTCKLAARWLDEHHTACVHTGADAMHALSRLHFDIVVSNTVLPDLDGFAMLRRVRESQPWVRIVAMTGRGESRSAFECGLQARECGADEVLLKPFGAEQLHTAVKNATALRALHLN